MTLFYFSTDFNFLCFFQLSILCFFMFLSTVFFLANFSCFLSFYLIWIFFSAKVSFLWSFQLLTALFSKYVLFLCTIFSYLILLAFLAIKRSLSALSVYTAFLQEMLILSLNRFIEFLKVLSLVSVNATSLDVTQEWLATISTTDFNSSPAELTELQQFSVANNG